MDMTRCPPPPGLRRPARVGPLFGALYDGAAVVIAAFLLIGAALVAFAISGSGPSGSGPAAIVRPLPPGHGGVPPGLLKKPGRWVRVVTLTPALATRHKVRYREGVLVIEVRVEAAGGAAGPGGAGDVVASLQERDVIIGVNGRPVANEADLAALLARHRDEEWVEVMVVRAGRMVPVRVSPDAFDL